MTLCASAIIEKQVLEAYCIQVCPSVNLWLSLCVPNTLRTPYLKNQWREFHPFLSQM